MASITRIRKGLFDVLNTIPKLQVYPKLTESIELGDGGAVVVGPMSYVSGAMGRGNFEYEVTLYVIVSLTDYSVATDQLDELVNPFGPRSIYEAIWDNRSLGVLDSDGLVDVDASVSGMSNYGGTLADAAGIDHLAAQLTVTIQSPGRP